MRFVLLTLAFSVSTASAQRSPAPAGGACLGKWSAPFHIQQADGKPVYVERGVITALDGRVLALGAPTFFWLGKDHIAPPEMTADTARLVWSFTRGGAFVDSTGRASAVPMVDTLRARRMPRLIGWTPARLDVVWSASDSVARSGFQPEAERLDVASFDGQHWSAAQTVLRSRRVDMSVLPATRAAVPFNLGVVAAPSSDSTGPLFVRLARRIDGRWSTADWRGATFVAYATASPTADGSTVVAMMATMSTGGDGVYALRAQGGAGDSVRWSQPQRIDTLGSGFSAFSAAHLGGDSLVLAWVQEAGGSATRLVTAVSADGGRAWTLTAPLASNAAIDSHRLIVDASGRLHIVYQGAREPGVLNAPGAVMHSMWESGVWTKPVAVSIEESMTGPAVGAAPHGGLIAMWTEATWLAQGPMPRSLASVWVDGCSPRNIR